MNSSLRELADLVDVCYSYYLHGETQSTIAKRMGVSRAKVCKMIAEANNRGIVKIEINDPLKRINKLEKALCERFGLRETKIVPVPSYGTVEITELLGRTAAALIRNLLRNGDTIGISGGVTLYEVIKYFEPTNLQDITVVPLMGGYSEIEVSTHGSEIARTLAEKVHGRLISVPAPVLVEDAQIHEIFVSNDMIKKGLEVARNCSIAIVGIGATKEGATFFRRNYLSKEDLEFLKKLNSVGCICLQYYDKNGMECHEFNSRVVGVTLEDIKHIPLVIGVAGGLEGKAEAIKGALANKYIHILVTDQITAEEILGDNP